MDQVNFRDVLKDEFSRRRGRNSFYSLRAFARDIGISPARLSEILVAKKGLSPGAAKKIAAKLGLSPDQQLLFKLSVEAQHGRSALSKRNAKDELQRALEKVPAVLPRHSTVLHWTTEATLKLSEREDFKADNSFLAKIFGLPAYMGFGVGFLSRAGLLPGAPQEKAYLAKRLAGKRINVDYEQILELARKAFLTHKSNLDHFEHEPLLISSEDIPKVRKIILRTYEDIKRLQSKKSSSKLHYLSTQFFCVDHERKNQ